MSQQPAAPTIINQCQMCGAQAPSRRVTFFGNIGMLIMRYNFRVAGYMCRACISKQFWKHFAMNLFLGWWGVISFFVTPVYIVIDIYNYILGVTSLRGHPKA